MDQFFSRKFRIFSFSRWSLRCSRLIREQHCMIVFNIRIGVSMFALLEVDKFKLMYLTFNSDGRSSKAQETSPSNDTYDFSNVEFSHRSFSLDKLQEYTVFNGGNKCSSNVTCTDFTVCLFYDNSMVYVPRSVHPSVIPKRPVEWNLGSWWSS